ncbi:MAG: hypothetical protein ACPF9W_10470 [Nocardioides sp.]
MYTHIVGHPTCRPKISLLGNQQAGQFAIAASKDFEGPGVDNFYHQIQNLDLEIVNGNSGAAGPRGGGLLDLRRGGGRSRRRRTPQP